MKVMRYPKTIVLGGALISNPSEAQCQAAGYELYTEAELAAMAQEQATASQEHEAFVEGLRDVYRAAVHKFCEIAGIESVDKFEDASVITTCIENANAVQDVIKALGLTQAALAIQNAITELRRKDGDDAWERI